MPFLLFFVLKFLLANLMIFNFWSIFGLILLGKSQKEQNQWQYYYRCHQKTKTCETENVLCVVELSTTTIEKITTRDSTQNIKGKQVGAVRKIGSSNWKSTDYLQFALILKASI